MMERNNYNELLAICVLVSITIEKSRDFLLYDNTRILLHDVNNA